MNSSRIIILDRAVDSIKQRFMKEVLSKCIDKNEGAYVLCALMHDFMNMTYSAISQECESQEAKAAFKIALDQVLIEYGLSVAIHEFKQ